MYVLEKAVKKAKRLCELLLFLKKKFANDLVNSNKSKRKNERATKTQKQDWNGNKIMLL